MHDLIDLLATLLKVILFFIIIVLVSGGSVASYRIAHFYLTAKIKMSTKCSDVPSKVFMQLWEPANPRPRLYLQLYKSVAAAETDICPAANEKRSKAERTHFGPIYKF